MLCGTLTRSLRVAGAYRPNDFMMFRYQLLARAIHNDDQLEIPHQPRLHVADHLHQGTIAGSLRYGDMEMLVPFQKRVVTVLLPWVIYRVYTNRTSIGIVFETRRSKSLYLLDWIWLAGTPMRLRFRPRLP